MSSTRNATKAAAVAIQASPRPTVAAIAGASAWPATSSVTTLPGSPCPSGLASVPESASVARTPNAKRQPSAIEAAGGGPPWTAVATPTVASEPHVPAGPGILPTPKNERTRLRTRRGAKEPQRAHRVLDAARDRQQRRRDRDETRETPLGLHRRAAGERELGQRDAQDVDARPVEDRGADRDALADHLRLAPRPGLEVAARGFHRAAQRGDEELSREDDRDRPRRDDPRHVGEPEQEDHRAEDQELVDEGVGDAAEDRDLAALPGDVAVEAVRRSEE